MRKKENRRPADPRPCAQCAAMFRPARKSRPTRFCSLKCVWIATKGAEFNARIAREHAQSNGDKKRGLGEKTKYLKFAGRHMHRVVVERMLGRKLLSNEIVHHINGDSWDNRAENLQVMTRADHIREHLPMMHERYRQTLKQRKET